MQRGPFCVTVFRCDRLKDAEPGASDDVKAVWKAIDEHWDKKSRCVLGLKTLEGMWRLWVRPDYDSGFWRAVDLLEGKTTMATFSGSWLVEDPTGLMSIGEMSWSSTQTQPPAQSESEQRALDQLKALGDGAPLFMKTWAADRLRKPVFTKHSPRAIE